MTAPPALQPERTSLAWTRTAVGLAVVSLLFLRWAPEHGRVALLVAGGGVLAAGGLQVMERCRARRRSHAFQDGVARATAAPALAASAAVVVLAAAGLAVVLLT